MNEISGFVFLVGTRPNGITSGLVLIEFFEILRVPRRRPLYSLLNVVRYDKIKMYTKYGHDWQTFVLYSD